MDNYDIENKKPRLSTIMGGLSGPCIKPIAIASIYKLYKEVDIPIIGIGGISNYKDILEFLIAGSTFVQLGTINYKYPNLINSMEGKLSDYLKSKSISDIKNIVGELSIEN